MNKTAIRNFAVWAREKLIADITYRAGMLGITQNGIAEKLPQSTADLNFFDIGTKDYAEIKGKEISQRNALVSAIKHKETEMSGYKEAFEYVVEEVAYTWFNRLIAIRFMEVNDYLPSGIRVLSSENRAKNEPDFVTSPFDTDLEFTDCEQEEIIRNKEENRLDDLFRMLFIKQCNKLHDILPELFEVTDDYTELLLTISFTDKDGIVYRLVHDIDEDDFNVEKEGQVEIIGWMYQYYNIEPKAAVFARPKGKKISKEEIPAATQLFTPDWIVRYMLENSLGRLWIEGHPNEELKADWKYYIDEAEQEPEAAKRLEEIKLTSKGINPENIKIIDPCMGSGHILVYAFDVMMQIYVSLGYEQREAAERIVQYNIYGIDIDKRAYQLAYFAVMMKARQYNRRILNKEIEPNLCVIKNSKTLSQAALEKMGDFKDITQQLIADFADAEEYGSIMSVSLSEDDLQNISNQVAIVESYKDSGSLIDIAGANEAVSVLMPLIKQAKMLLQKYDVVITNPPYMPASNASSKLSNFVKEHYPDSKTDLFAVFIERCREMLEDNGYQAMITMHSWMFLSSYEKLREKLLNNVNIVNMVHLGARAFEEIGGEVVQTTSFVLDKSCIKEYKGTYCRLIEPNTQQGKEDMFLNGENRYVAEQSNFSKIPGGNIAYWASEKLFTSFINGKVLGSIANSKQGLATADNNRFLRQWFEVYNGRICFDCNSEEESASGEFKWFPYNKGGEFRKWYGNNDYVINWEFNGNEIRNFVDAKGKLKSRPQNTKFYFKPSFSWSLVTSGSIAFRYKPQGFIFDVAGMSCFSNMVFYYLLALCNTKVTMKVLEIIAPTINYQCGDIANIPVIFEEKKEEEDIDEMVKECIQISKNDWDTFEISWDFKRHPLI